MWGKIKNTGDDWMYPKPLMDLRSALILDYLDFVLFTVKDFTLLELEQFWVHYLLLWKGAGELF